MLVLILILTIALPLAWLAAEFQPNRPLRVVLGICAIAMSYLVAWGVGTLDRLGSNIWYGTASKDLIENTITELESGNTERVIAELRVLRDKLHPTYETRADYDKLVATYVYAISESPTLGERNDPRWADNVPESHRQWADDKKAEQGD
jgi:hypothetical protein